MGHIKQKKTHIALPLNVDSGNGEMAKRIISTNSHLKILANHARFCIIHHKFIVISTRDH